MKRNLIAHHKNNFSDKIYIASVRNLPSGRWEVLGKWGKRHCQRIQLNIKGVFDTEAEAAALMTRLFSEKIYKGYVDIDNPRYTDTVTRLEVRNFLEDEVDTNFLTPPEEIPVKPEEKIPVSFPQNDEQGLVVRCVNNLGLEHLFEVGVEYNAETTNDDEMLKVTDMTGKRTEVFAERFERVP
jgi:predicted DNA-binding WGR domain protein